jgi:hypothetical protein
MRFFLILALFLIGTFLFFWACDPAFASPVCYMVKGGKNVVVPCSSLPFQPGQAVNGIPSVPIKQVSAVASGAPGAALNNEVERRIRIFSKRAAARGAR